LSSTTTTPDLPFEEAHAKITQVTFVGRLYDAGKPAVDVPSSFKPRMKAEFHLEVSSGGYVSDAKIYPQNGLRYPAGKLT
jgi:hypothetical protein